MPTVPTDEDLRSELRSHGLRSTGSRVAVLRLLRGAHGPISHSDVETRLSKRGWDRVTLYRNLNDLARAGLARRTNVGDRTWRFEARAQTSGAKDDTGDGHVHFVCTDCGDVKCLDDVTVEVRMQPKAVAPRSVRAGRVEVQVRGICDRCA